MSTHDLQDYQVRTTFEVFLTTFKVKTQDQDSNLEGLVKKVFHILRINIINKFYEYCCNNH